nr:MAG TPA: hypothetical protein [Caudoviricetes sp.]
MESDRHSGRTYQAFIGIIKHKILRKVLFKFNN